MQTTLSRINFKKMTAEIKERANTITYEQPLNETIRICLRLEYLFNELYEHLHSPTTATSQIAINALLKIINVTDRPDLKTKLSSILHQQATSLAQLEQFPQVDHTKLANTLHELDRLIDALHHAPGKFGESLRLNAFLNQVRLQLNNPSGICEFSAPAYTLWLNQPSKQRIHDLKQWSHPFGLLHEIVSTLLHISRDSAGNQRLESEKDFYQQSLNPNLPCQLLRITIPAEYNIYPEMSVGKHRIAIRFKHLDPQSQGLTELQHHIQFWLACCRI